jgi:membrane protease YdiL (CAAX protease family)
MTRKPAFWIVLALLGLAGSVLALRLFPVAFPILSVDIEMDRQDALGEARALAERYQWEPFEFRQAASFAHLNPAFQTYMELEGGGLEELNGLVEDGVFTLYAWRVRHFAEQAIEEAEVLFTPQGEIYGFQLLLSEDAPGLNLGPEEARELAVAEASGSWGMDPNQYELLESSQEESPGGRIDHTFTLERSDISLGEGRVRLRLGVAGDRLIEVTPFLHVPEGFLRRYQETRNANESVSLAGTVVFLLLFLVLGGGVGAVHLLRKRWIEWKAPLVWGGTVAGLMALDQINTLPLSWMSYNTALPPQVHVATLALMAFVTFLGGTVFLTLLFITGEGLMRLGFPEEIQQWKLWAPGVANSTPALGRTSAPYLALGAKLGFVVAFYLFTSRVLGWWSPASALAAPDLLATRFPWLTAVSTSLFASLSEETIFRAIPIGAAAILGRRHGRPWVWIWGAVVLQALVFGASHANYPQQPAYARVVEIFPTYLAWGLACVFFGLVPAIIGHYLYDLVFFSLPLFAVETGGIWIDRSIVIFAGVLPLLVVFWARSGRFLGPLAKGRSFRRSRLGTESELASALRSHIRW